MCMYVCVIWQNIACVDSYTHTHTHTHTHSRTQALFFARKQTYKSISPPTAGRAKRTRTHTHSNLRTWTPLPPCRVCKWAENLLSPPTRHRYAYATHTHTPTHMGTKLTSTCHLPRQFPLPNWKITNEKSRRSFSHFIRSLHNFQVHAWNSFARFVFFFFLFYKLEMLNEKQSEQISKKKNNSSIEESAR